MDKQNEDVKLSFSDSLYASLGSTTVRDRRVHRHVSRGVDEPVENVRA